MILFFAVVAQISAGAGDPIHDPLNWLQSFDIVTSIHYNPVAGNMLATGRGGVQLWDFRAPKK